MTTLETQLSQEIATLKEKLEEAQRQLEFLRRQVFGRKSERFVPHQEGGHELFAFMNEVEEAPAAEAAPVQAPARKKRIANGQDALVVPEGIETEIRVIDIPESEKIDPITGDQAVLVGTEVVRKLAYRPREFFLIEFHYPRYAFPKAPKIGVVQAEAVKTLVQSPIFDSGFMAWICCSKLNMALPLYRQVEFLRNRGIEVSLQTLSRLFCRLGDEVAGVAAALRDEILAGGVLHVDETTMPMLVKGKGRTHTGYIWCYRAGRPGDSPYAWYEFTDNRSHEHPKKILKDFAGLIHADAYGAYSAIHADPAFKIKWQACWAHARRKFEALKGTAFGAEILRLIKTLFLLERAAWRRNAKDRLQLRARWAAPLSETIITKLRARLLEFNDPKNAGNAAANYILNRVDNFKLFLTHAELRLDNNAAERAIRRIAIGRKNSMFVGSKNGGTSTASLLSLIQSARNLGLDPQAYLTWLFDELPKFVGTKDGIRQFLPKPYAEKLGLKITPIS